MLRRPTLAYVYSISDRLSREAEYFEGLFQSCLGKARQSPFLYLLVQFIEYIVSK